MELGVGRPVFANGSYSSVNIPGHSADYNLTGTVYYTRKFARHWYWGIKSSFEQYSFTHSDKRNDSTLGASGSGTYATNVNHKSSYLHFGPMIDLGVGRHREYLHFFASATVGLLLNAYQETQDYHDTYNLPTVYDSTYRTDTKVNPAIFRFTFGMRQQFPLTKTWFATISESYSAMPFGDISQATATGGAGIHPGFLTLQFGVMHKFKDAHKVTNSN